MLLVSRLDLELDLVGSLGTAALLFVELTADAGAFFIEGLLVIVVDSFFDLEEGEGFADELGFLFVELAVDAGAFFMAIVVDSLFDLEEGEGFADELGFLFVELAVDAGAFFMAIVVDSLFDLEEGEGLADELGFLFVELALAAIGFLDEAGLTVVDAFFTETFLVTLFTSELFSLFGGVESIRSVVFELALFSEGFTIFLLTVAADLWLLLLVGDRLDLVGSLMDIDSNGYT